MKQFKRISGLVVFAGLLVCVGSVSPMKRILDITKKERQEKSPGGREATCRRWFETAQAAEKAYKIECWENARSLALQNRIKAMQPVSEEVCQRWCKK